MSRHLHRIHVMSKHFHESRSRVAERLEGAGLARDLIRERIEARDWPSLRDVVRARMESSNLEAPLPPKEVARLSRALSRLGYEEDEVWDELEGLR